jgi:hypothetical protein
MSRFKESSSDMSFKRTPRVKEAQGAVFSAIPAWFRVARSPLAQDAKSKSGASI